MGMDHGYIDEHAVAERYLGNTLALEDREAFERHLVDCQECTDRILLAGMFHARLGNGAGPTQVAPQGASALESPRALKSLQESAPPPALFVRLKPLQILWILLISALLLVAIPALVWRIFERYSGR